MEEGGVAESKVRAYGFPLNYQWFKNNQELPEQNKYQLYVVNPSLNDNGSTYFVKIANSKGTVESKKLTLSVTPFTGPVIYSTSTPPIIDAKADAIWDKAQPIALKNLIRGDTASEADLSASFKLLWDDSNLYIFAQITDDVMSTKENKSYSQDAIEIFLDADNSKPQLYGKEEYQLHFSRNDSVVETLQGNLTKEIVASQKNTGNGYVMELAIPWEAIQGKPRSEKYIGIELQVIDNDNGPRNTKISWSGKQDLARRSPMSFGTMKLVNK